MTIGSLVIDCYHAGVSNTGMAREREAPEADPRTSRPVYRKLIFSPEICQIPPPITLIHTEWFKIHTTGNFENQSIS